MKFSPLPVSSVSAPTRMSDPAPPARWSRWWTSPIAKLDYGTDSRMPLWPEARIPAERGLSGALRPSLTFGGSSLEAAIEAAKLITAVPVDVQFSFRNGRLGTTPVHPAIAILRDSRAGAFWLAPLQTTVRFQGEWLDAPHTIDGPAFEGEEPLLATPKILSATRDMVAVVGRDTVLKPGVWADAPDDSIVRDEN